MSSRFEVRLTDDQRRFLRDLAQRGHCTVTTLTRVQVLLAADTTSTGGMERSDDVIASELRTSASTVYRVRKRFATYGLPCALFMGGRMPARTVLPLLDR